MQRLHGLLCATLRMRPLPCFTCTDQQLLMCLLPAQIVELSAGWGVALMLGWSGGGCLLTCRRLLAHAVHIYCQPGGCASRCCSSVLPSCTLDLGLVIRTGASLAEGRLSCFERCLNVL
jgi:hypothetical protein